MGLNIVDPRAYLNDPQETLRLAMESKQSGVWTAMPAVVTAVDLTKMTVEATPTIQVRWVDPNGVLQYLDMPPCLDVPICFPSGGGFLITLPIEVGDEVLLVFASRCIDSWWQNGGYQNNKPMEFRMHDLSDGFAIPGPRSQPKLPLGSVSATDLQIRNDAGTVFLSIGADGKIGFANVATTLKSVLTDLESLLNTFMTTLAGFSGGGAPTTQAMLQVPAAAAEAALVPVLVKIGALLK